MKLVINGKTRSYEQEGPRTVGELLLSLEIEESRGVAVALNEEVVPKSRWDDAALSDGDEIEIIRAAQGG